MEASNYLNQVKIIENLHQKSLDLNTSLVIYQNSKFVLKKISKKFILKKSKQVEHIKNEKQALLEFDHPSIIKLSSTFQDSDYLYMLLEVAEGVCLSTLLKVYHVLPPKFVQLIMALTIEVLEYIHQMGFVYRDLKASHIFLDAQLKLKLIDFGFTKKIENQKTLSLCGTLHAMAPEMISLINNSKGEGYSYEIDYYALGILFYELRIGNPPFGYIFGNAKEHEKNMYFQQVLQGITPDLLSQFSDSEKLFVQDLLRINPNNRLGNNLNFLEIKSHKYFDGFVWEELNQPSLLQKIGNELNEYIDYIDLVGLYKNISKSDLESANVTIDEDDPFKNF